MSEQFAEQAEAVVDNDTSALDAEPSEVLDEDRLGDDPLEDGMDTAEGYSRQVRLGGTQDAEDQDSLAYRIPQEEPDVEADEQPGRPVAATPAMELDESVDDAENAVDGTAGVDGLGDVDDDVEGEWPTEGAERQALHVEQGN